MNKRTFSVLVDTSYLITLTDSENPKRTGKVAQKYQKDLENNKAHVFLSPIVVAEFCQKQSMEDLLKTYPFQFLNYTVRDAITTAELLKNLKAKTGARSEFKDDYKIIAQAKTHNIDFIITEDKNTLSKYINRLLEQKELKL